jgi:hypothetical protein
MNKEDFIAGDWYNYNNNYYKFKEFKNDYFYCSEYIYNSIWRARVWDRIWFGLVGMDSIINISEIAHLLPKNHPDLLLLNKEIIEQDYSYLIKILERYGI